MLVLARQRNCIPQIDLVWEEKGHRQGNRRNRVQSRNCILVKVQSPLIVYQNKEGSETWITKLCLTSLAELDISNEMQSGRRDFCKWWSHSVPKVILNYPAVSHSSFKFGDPRRATHKKFPSKESTCTGLEHSIAQEMRKGSQEACQRGWNMR